MGSAERPPSSRAVRLIAACRAWQRRPSSVRARNGPRPTRAPAARVVLVSGFGVEVSPEDLRSYGVDLVLAKPLRLLDLESAVALARSGQGG